MTIGAFVLTEGNVGTLFRHRAMLIPVTIIIASPGIVVAMRALRRWLQERRAPAVTA